MSQTIRRGGAGARKSAARQQTRARVNTAKAKTGSVVDGALAMVPVSERQLHRIFLAVILGCVVAVVWFVAMMAGVPAMATQEMAGLARSAGFEVRRVEVRGVKRLNELKVYEIALAERDQAMPMVDVGGLRDRLLALSWVEDARVSRQLPETLVIDIVERVPQAVLRRADKLVLIDATGHELEPVSPAKARGKLVLSGFGVEDKVPALGRLLDAAPALRPQVAAAQWVGNRRWNLTFQTGQVLELPEGDQPSAAALVAFARLDGTNRLIGGKATAFDMRAADRIYFRVPHGDDAAPSTTTTAPAPAKPATKPAAALASAADSAPSGLSDKLSHAPKAVTDKPAAKPAKHAAKASDDPISAAIHAASHAKKPAHQEER